MAKTAEVIKTFEFYQTHPYNFCTDILGCTPDENQRQILEAVAENKEVAIKSCHSLGKDWLSARILLWFVYTHIPSLVISTAPTDRQVKGILWQEVAIAHYSARFKLGGTILKQELYAGPDQRALGFTATETTKFQGWHCPNILFILDEAAGIDKEIYNAVDSCLASGVKRRRVEIGNPTDPTSMFCESFKTKGIHQLSYSAFETPNFTHFGITEEDITNDTWQEKITEELPAPYLITPEWVRQRYVRWGPENPLYLARVKAEFPSEGEDALISMAHIEAAKKRTLEPGLPNVIGVDVARYGSDYSVIAHRRGPVIRILMRFAKEDTMTTTGHARRLYWEKEAHSLIVDADGLGSGVVDRLRELRESVIEAHFGAASSDPEMFLNARAEWYWTLREAFEIGKIDLDPADEELAAQLSDIRWKPDSKGRITIERKEDMRKRGVASPDDADAVAMTFDRFASRRDIWKKALKNV